MPGGEHEDRHPGPRADLAAHVDSPEVGQTEVQDDKVGTFRRCEVDPFPAGRGLEQPIGYVAERVAEGGPERRRALDYQPAPPPGRRAPPVVVLASGYA